MSIEPGGTRFINAVETHAYNNNSEATVDGNVSRDELENYRAYLQDKKDRGFIYDNSDEALHLRYLELMFTDGIKGHISFSDTAKSDTDDDHINYEEMNASFNSGFVVPTPAGTPGGRLINDIESYIINHVDVTAHQDGKVNLDELEAYRAHLNEEKEAGKIYDGGEAMKQLNFLNLRFDDGENSFLETASLVTNDGLIGKQEMNKAMNE